MIRAIFLDIDGTLVDRASAHRRYCLDLMSRHPDAFPARRNEANLAALSEGAESPSWDRRAFASRAASA